MARGLWRLTATLSILSLVAVALGADAPDKSAKPAAKPAAKAEHKPQPTFNSPAEAGPDYLVQGEYAGARGMQ